MKSLKHYSLILLVFYSYNIPAQVTLDADGPGNTYELITSVLAPNANPIEAPDCAHESFGNHIDEIFDSELNTDVFRFYLHTNEDNDRCINFDRQRNEIKTYSPSPDNLKGIEGETVIYKWKFKLAEGFQSSPNFTHLHQLKAVGDNVTNTPLYTLTTRKGNPDRIELRYAEASSQETLIQTALAPFIGEWLDVTEVITYGTDGAYSLVIKKVIDHTILLQYENDQTSNWQTGSDFVRPKWGIYRSLINEQDLRDEEVRYANFSIEEQEVLSTEEFQINSEENIHYNTIDNTLSITNINPQVNSLKIFSLDGKIMLSQELNQSFEETIDVSTINDGSYILTLQGNTVLKSKVILIAN